MSFKWSTLGELSIGGGKYGISAPAVEFDRNLPAYLRITDINDDGSLNLSGRKSVADPLAFDYMLQEGDIVFARTGSSTGRNYYYDLRDGDFAFAGFLIKFSLDKEKVNPRFIKYYVQSKPYWDWVSSFNTGSTRGNINAKTYAQMPVPLPDRDVQDAIVCLCDSLSNKIRINNRLNDYLDEYASALFEDWISRCTETATIGDIAQEILDYTKYSGPYVKLINSSDVTEGIFPDPEPVENKDLKGHFKKRFKKHDILYSEIRPRNHHYGYVMFDAVDWISTTRLMVIRNRPEKISSALLYYYLKSRPVTEEFTLKTETRSGTFPQGKYIDMAAIEVPYLPVEKQAGIAQSITTILETIYANQAENERLVKLRDTLLPKLMSGEMNVSKIALPAHSNNH